MDNNINSVANYLSIAKKRRGNIRKAIWDYNHSEFYVRAVEELAEARK